MKEADFLCFVKIKNPLFDSISFSAYHTRIKDNKSIHLSNNDTPTSINVYRDIYALRLCVDVKSITTNFSIMTYTHFVYHEIKLTIAIKKIEKRR